MPAASPKIIARTFFSLIARNAATNERIAINPKNTINKFMKKITLLSTSNQYVVNNVPSLFYSNGHQMSRYKSDVYMNNAISSEKRHKAFYECSFLPIHCIIR